jgi:hypothetical protein
MRGGGYEMTIYIRMKVICSKMRPCYVVNVDRPEIDR